MDSILYYRLIFNFCVKNGIAFFNRLFYDYTMLNTDEGVYRSPFSWRYGSREMRHVFSEEHKYRLWRKIWVALAAAEHKAGLVTTSELRDIQDNETNIDISRILEIEKETKHDVVAAIKEFAEKAAVGGGKIHLGATSMDVVDNADAIRMKEALILIDVGLVQLLGLFARLIKTYSHHPCMGYTHLQPAEPTTVGYRLALYAQDLLLVHNQLSFVMGMIRGKGMKGAVGTSAGYSSLLKGTKMTAQELENIVMKNLGIAPALIATQVYPRQYDYVVVSTLAQLGSVMAKFAGDLRLLQSPTIGEWSEPFAKKQVGSSAMPFKKNPIQSENICSLARFVSGIPHVLLENVTHSYLERTLDDSANKRIVVPEAFLAVDHMILTAKGILSGLVINEKRIAINLNLYAPFAATEAVLIAGVKKGADRQELHESLREISMKAWGEVQEGKKNRMKEFVMANKYIMGFIQKKQIESLFTVTSHIGDAPDRAFLLVKQIEKIKPLQ